MIIKRMKVKYLLLSLMGALALSASAQQPEATESQLPANRTAFEQSNGHWFISVQGGVGAQFFGANPGGKNGVEFGEYMKHCIVDMREGAVVGNIVPALSVGKWHNPYFATRLQLQGAYMPTVFNTTNGYDYLKTLFIGGHFDFMFDVVNYFAAYNPNRVFHFIPFAGLGYQFKFHGKFHEPYRHSATANAGLIFSFRLGKRVDLFLEAQGVYSNLNFTQRDVDFKGEAKEDYLKGTGAYNGLAAIASIGLNFNLGETDWKVVTPMDYELINDLNRQINSLKAENAELSKRPVSCPECPEVAPAEEIVTSATISDKAILFKFDSDVIAPNQDLQLSEIARLVKENNIAVLVIGYADTTGNTEYNMGLSERRAKAVADALVNTYGVDSNLVTTEWQGETEQFTPKAWNRVVIVRSK